MKLPKAEPPPFLARQRGSWDEKQGGGTGRKTSFLGKIATKGKTTAFLLREFEGWEKKKKSDELKKKRGGKLGDAKKKKKGLPLPPKGISKRGTNSLKEPPPPPDSKKCFPCPPNRGHWGGFPWTKLPDLRKNVNS